MDKQSLTHLINNLHQLKTIDIEHLHQLSIKYPYAAIFPLLLMKKRQYMGETLDFVDFGFRVPDRIRLQDFIRLDLEEEIEEEKVENISECQQDTEVEVINEREETDTAVEEVDIVPEVSDNPPVIEWDMKKELEKKNKKNATNGKKKRRFKFSRIPIFQDPSMLDDLLGDKDKEEKVPNQKLKGGNTRKNKHQDDEPIPFADIKDFPLGEPTPVYNIEEALKDVEGEDMAFPDNMADFMQNISNIKDKMSKSPNRSDKGEGVDDWAQNSLKENGEIVSETLAELFIVQGKNKKAIQMYRQLIDKMPEKKAFFLEKIAELEQK